MDANTTAKERSGPPLHFADRLIERTRTLGHPLCLGLDPHLPLMPPLFRRGTMTANDPQTPPQVEAFLRAVLDRYQGHVAVVKPQIAFFEQMGARGIAVLERTVAYARALGMLVILDAKRGDIDSTAAAYAAYLAPTSPLYCEAMTVNPYLGIDSLEPFTAAAEQFGGGVFVLVKTSNPGARDFQEFASAGERLFERVANALNPLAERLRGSLGWSALGAVVGAAYSADAQRIRELLPSALFLVPGFGAQGAGAQAAVAGFVQGPRGREGGVVNSSRALLFPPGSDTRDAAAWERAIDQARERATETLRAAVQS